MKLHLPTSLRRALLAVIALLSPAVVTTTFATATLAAISAPAMAGDLTLNGTHSYSEDEEYGTVTTSSANDVIQAEEWALTFTADTVNVGAGHMLTVKGANEYCFPCFTVKELNIAEGGFINFIDDTTIYAVSDVTLYELFNNVSAGSVKGTGFSLHGAGHSAAETEKLVKSSDLFEKLNSEAQGYITITEGNLIIDSDSDKKCKIRIGDQDDETPVALATITSDVTRLDGLGIHSDGELTIGSASEKLVLKDLDVYGKLKSQRDLILEGICTIAGKLEIDRTIENNGTLRLKHECHIYVISSSFAEEYVSHTYTDGHNGYLQESTYTAITGAGTLTVEEFGTMPGEVFWHVDGKEANYADGKVTVVYTTPDTSVYHVRNGDVPYTQSLAQPNAIFSLEGGHLQLSETLLDTQSIVSKNSNSWVCLKNSQVELKSSQISLAGAKSVTLQAPDAGTYIIDKKVDEVIELTLGTGVELDGGNWWGTVKTAGDTIVKSNVDTTSWINTELNGTTTVNNGATLTLGNNTTLKGKIVNNGTLVLGGKIDVDSSKVVHTSRNTYASTGDANDLGTESGSGFATALNVYSVVEGNAATGSANWTVGGQAAHYDSGKVSLLTNKDTATWWMNSDATYSEVVGNFEADTSTLALNTEDGTLKLNATPGVKLVSKKSATVEIGSDVTLKASQLDASAADVTLSGGGSYTMTNGANTLGSGVSVGSGWSGTVNTTGNTTALELDTLGVSGSKVELGSNSHTLAARDQSVAANLNSTGSISLTGNKLTLSGTNTLGSLNVGSLEITGGSTTITDGLTTDSISGTVSVTGGTLQEATAGSAISTSGTVSLSGVTLGAVLNNSGTLSFAGNMTLDTSLLGASPENENWYSDSNAAGEPGTTGGSGFRTIQDIYTVVTGATADNTADWQLTDGRDAEYAGGKVLAFQEKDFSTYWVNTNSSVSLDTADGEFTADTTTIALNGGKLVVDTNTGLTLQSHVASAVEIADGSALKARQLDASAAKVTLSGGGSYDMQGQELSGEVKLDNGVVLDANEWKGTVYTGSTAQGAALDVRALGNRQSSVCVGARPILRATPAETVLESLTAAGVGTTVVPGSLTLQKGDSTADALVVNGILTLGSTDTAASLKADSVNLLGLNFAHADSSLVAGKLEGATTLNVQLMDEVLGNKDAGETLTLVTLEDGFDGTLTFNGSTETERVRSEDNRKEYTLAWNEDGTVLTLTILGTETYVAEQVKSTSPNGQAGEALVTDVFLNDTPAAGGALESILNAVDAGTASDRDMAAVAGASTAALGMALSGDVERQLRAIRNRSISGAYGHDAVALNDGKGGAASMPESNRYFAWVNAEGNRAEQNADGCAAGYTLSSWGGTVGAGMQVNNQLTLGLALTAMYGDLQSDGPDGLDGDMDTAYLSAFARYESGNWSHAFIGTAGTMEVDYKRTAMGYSTDGDTDGTAFGLMYEVSREFELSNRSKLSPVFNIAYRHTAVDGYSESGTDAALNVGEQSLDTVTVGLGARYAAVLGQQTMNRACAFEARALVKYDLGDRQSSTSTGFIDHATRVGIESAELGAFGVELGAGISVPVGSGSIFADGSVELRSDYTNFNAAVGYRIQF